MTAFPACDSSCTFSVPNNICTEIGEVGYEVCQEFSAGASLFRFPGDRFGSSLGEGQDGGDYSYSNAC